MSIAKRSMKWLVLTVIVFALVLTSVFSLTWAVNAQAEPSQGIAIDTLKVIASVTGPVGSSYPDLVQSNKTTTLTVSYYFSAPDATENPSTDDYWVEFYGMPVITVPGDNGVIKPTNVTGRSGKTFAEAVYDDHDNIVNYNIYSVTANGTIADAIGVAENSGVYSVSNAANYLFQATFVIPANAVLGEYAFGFDAASLDATRQIAYGNNGYYDFEIVANGYWDAAIKGTFNVRTEVAVPVAETGLIYDGTPKAGVIENGVYSVSDNSAVDAGNYQTTVSLNTACYFWADSNFDGTINWSIAKRDITVGFDNATYQSTYGGATATVIFTYSPAISSSMEQPANVGYVVYDADNQNQVAESITNTTPAGTYTLRLTGPNSSDNYNFDATATATYIVNRAAATVEIVTPEEDNVTVKTYNGVAVSVGTVNSDSNIEYSVSHNETASVTINWKYSNDDDMDAAPVAPGTYKVQVQIGNSANYAGASSEWRTFMIGRALQTVSIEASDRIYNGANIAIGTDVTVTSNSANYANASLVTTGSTVGSTTTYAAGNATTHYFKVFVPGDSNYADYISETQTLAISPLAIVLTPVNVSSVNYTGNNITSFSCASATVVAASGNETAYAAYLSNKNISSLNDKITFNVVNNGTVKNAGTYDNGAMASNFAFADNFDSLSNFSIATGYASVTVNKVANTLTFSVSDNDPEAPSMIPLVENVKAKARDYNGAEITAARSGADITLTTLENDGNLVIKWYADDNGARGSVIDAPVLSGTYWIGVAVGEGDNHFAVAEQFRQFEIGAVDILITFAYQFNNVTYPLYLENGVLRDKTSADPNGGFAFMPGASIPAAPSFNYFTTEGFVFNNELVTTATLAVNNATLIATYQYNVGLADVCGDGAVNTDDVYTMRQFIARRSLLTSKTPLADAADAWEQRSTAAADLAKFYFSASLDANGDNAFNAADVVAVRQALATGYGYYIIAGEGQKGQKLVATTYQNVDTFALLVEKVTAGYPVKLTQDIDAVENIFNVNLASAALIDLQGHTLTVDAFTLTSSANDATLRITNGKIVAVGDIVISAPNGNVVISGLQTFNYEGAEVEIQAYSSSLHIEENVGFFKYKHENKTLQEVRAMAADADVFAEIVSQTIAPVKATVAAKVADLADADATVKAAAVNALKEIAKPVSIPVDTHVVVENAANLIASTVQVTEAARAVQPGETQTTTFAIEVKNSDAVVVSVDATSEAVEIIDIAGQETKVDITGEVAVKNTVKTYAELYSAMQKDNAVITLGDDIEMTNGITIQNHVVIDMNGKTLSIGNPNMTLMFYVFGSLEFTGTGIIKGNFTNSNELCAIWLTGSADNTVEAGSVSLVIGEGVTLMTNKCGVGVWPASSEYAYGVAIDVKGTIQSASYAITPNGNLKKHEGDVVNNEVSANVPTITVYGTASLISSRDDASAIYAAGFFKTVVKSGATLEGASAIYVKSGFMTIESGVTLNATKANKATYVFNGNGGDSTGDAIVIDNCFYPGENSVVTLGENLTFNVAASDATTVATYWAVGTPEQFATAIANNASYIFLKANIAVTSQIVVDNDMIIDLNGKTISYAGTDALASGVIGVKRGATLTINDNTASQAGMIDGSTNKTYAAVAVTLAADGSTGDLAKVIVNAGTLKGYYYGVVGNGTRHNTEIVVNGGTLYGINGSGLYNPQDGSVTINGGLIKGGETAIEIRAGQLVINGGEFEALTENFAITENGSGTTVAGVIIAISQHTTLKNITVTINDGTFVNGIRALGMYDTVTNGHTDRINVTINGGTFDSDIANAQTTTINVKNGNLVINDGLFNAGPDNDGLGSSTVYVQSYGNVTINGGRFSSDAKYAGRYWTLNKQNSAANTCTLEVKGGSYVEFDPSNPNTDDSVNYVANGFVAVLNNGIYTVVAAD